MDLEVKAGEVVALAGPSGAGKTTLANLVPRFYDVTAGRIAVDGRDLRDVDLASLRAQIGIVAQDTFLFNDTRGEKYRIRPPGRLDGGDSRSRSQRAGATNSSSACPRDTARLSATAA